MPHTPPPRLPATPTTPHSIYPSIFLPYAHAHYFLGPDYAHSSPAFQQLPSIAATHSRLSSHSPCLTFPSPTLAVTCFRPTYLPPGSECLRHSHGRGPTPHPIDSPRSPCTCSGLDTWVLGFTTIYLTTFILRRTDAPDPFRSPHLLPVVHYPATSQVCLCGGPSMPRAGCCASMPLDPLHSTLPCPLHLFFPCSAHVPFSPSGSPQTLVDSD